MENLSWFSIAPSTFCKGFKKCRIWAIGKGLKSAELGLLKFFEVLHASRIGKYHLRVGFLGHMAW